MWNDNTREPRNGLRKSEHANASAAEFVSLCYNYVRRVTSPSAVLLSLSLSVILYIFIIDKMKLFFILEITSRKAQLIDLSILLY